MFLEGSLNIYEKESFIMRLNGCDTFSKWMWRKRRNINM